jgi:hypothetical protein
VAVSLAVGITLAFSLLGAAQPGTPKDKPKGSDEYRLSGPYTHENLTIFLMHGEDRLKGKNFLTLSEALEQKKFVIHETKNVTELTMENLSPDQEVLILSGDILKGGQQDRISQFDLIVPPKSGKLPLKAFCVEHTAARWQRAWKDGDKHFADCKDVLASNHTRLSNRLASSQGEVWKTVSRSQTALAKNLNAEVKSAKSDSSLQLTLEAKVVREAADKYLAKLEGIVKDKKDVIGYAFAINGKVLYADVYCSPTLFGKLWPRLLRASAIEAVAELQKDKKFDPVTAKAVQAFLTEAEKAKASSKDISSRVSLQTQEAANCVLFEAVDRTQNLSIRRNYLSKK